MINVLKQNIHNIWRTWRSLVGSFATIVTIASVFVSWSDIKIEKFYVKVLFLVSVLFLLLIITIAYTCKWRKRKVIWQDTSRRIIVRYGELLKEGFDKTNERERLYVIPVNSAFDTIVDTNISICDKPLISPNTLHGKWIKMMNENGLDLEYIDDAIRTCLKKQKKKYKYALAEDKKKKGKREIYELGTVAVVRGVGHNTFLLLVLTDFDRNNNAYVSVENLEHVIKSLIDFNNQYGQGYELIIPLMGTNFSRLGLSYDDSLRIITNKLLLYKDKIRGDVSIIIHEADRDKVVF